MAENLRFYYLRRFQSLVYAVKVYHIISRVHLQKKTCTRHNYSLVDTQCKLVSTHNHLHHLQKAEHCSCHISLQAKICWSVLSIKKTFQESNPIMFN